MKNTEKTKKIGGQAVIEGVLMRSEDRVAVAVRNPKNRIIVKKERTKPISKILLWRGFSYIIDMLVVGFNALIWSAEVASGGKERLSKKELVFTLAVSILFALLLFVAVPFFVTLLITKENTIMFNLVEGLLRIALFLLYIIGVASMPDVKRVFEYHGAEHKVVNCYEKNKKLTYDNIKKCSTIHPRCGTSFLLIVLIVSILVFSIITTKDLVIRFVSRILLLPLIAGVSYEFLKLSDKYKNEPFFKLIAAPGIFLQMITTAEPDKRQIEVALKALNSLFP